MLNVFVPVERKIIMSETSPIILDDTILVLETPPVKRSPVCVTTETQMHPTLLSMLSRVNSFASQTPLVRIIQRPRGDSGRNSSRSRSVSRITDGGGRHTLRTAHSEDPVVGQTQVDEPRQRNKISAEEALGMQEEVCLCCVFLYSIRTREQFC